MGREADGLRKREEWDNDDNDSMTMWIIKVICKKAEEE